MSLHIVNEANRCLNCKKPMCQTGCPVSTAIPHIIKLFQANQLMEAGAELFENNPMSLICCIVCDHQPVRRTLRAGTEGQRSAVLRDRALSLRRLSGPDAHSRSGEKGAAALPE